MLSLLNWNPTIDNDTDNDKDIDNDNDTDTGNDNGTGNDNDNGTDNGNDTNNITLTLTMIMTLTMTMTLTMALAMTMTNVLLNIKPHSDVWIFTVREYMQEEEPYQITNINLCLETIIKAKNKFKSI